MEEYVKVDINNYVNEILKNSTVIEAEKFARIIAKQGIEGEEVISWSIDQNNTAIIEKKDTVKYTYRNIDFMFFRRDDDDKMKQLLEKYDPKINYSINIIGKLGMSTFMGRPKCQVIVDDYEIIEKNQQEILDDIEKNLKEEWKLNRISKMDLSILKLAIYEIKFSDITYKVSINEAVELAKKYGEDKSKNFVNGILASIVKEM